MLHADRSKRNRTEEREFAPVAWCDSVTARRLGRVPHFELRLVGIQEVVLVKILFLA